MADAALLLQHDWNDRDMLNVLRAHFSYPLPHYEVHILAE